MNYINDMKTLLEESESTSEFASSLNSVCMGNILEKVNKYSDILLRKKSQLTYKNDYGAIIKDSWYNEIRDFIESVCFPYHLKDLNSTIEEKIKYLNDILNDKIASSEVLRRMLEQGDSEIELLSENFHEQFYINESTEWWLRKYGEEKKYPEHLKYFELGYIATSLPTLIAAVDAATEDLALARETGKGYIFSAELNNQESQEDTPPSSQVIENGYEYEEYCASILRESGWDVLVRKKSGDQGADLVGSIGNTRVVFQCKFYSNPVGNQAVQEAIAGKVFEQADYGVVVTNSTFTKQARQLAEVAEIFLMHHDDLRLLAEKI